MSELNTTAALSTAALSSAVGFGLAFYIAAKINKGMLSKSQKVCVFVAMTSFGVGLTGVLNEFIGFPLQGLSVRGDKVVQYIFANIVVMPPIFLGIAYFLRSRTNQLIFKEEHQHSVLSHPFPSQSHRNHLISRKSIIVFSTGVLTLALMIWLFSQFKNNDEASKHGQSKIEANVGNNTTIKEWVMLEQDVWDNVSYTLYYDANSVTKTTKSNYLVVIAYEFDRVIKVKNFDERFEIANVKHAKRLIEFNCNEFKSKKIKSDIYSSSFSDTNQIRLNSSSKIEYDDFKPSNTAIKLCPILIKVR